MGRHVTILVLAVVIGALGAANLALKPSPRTRNVEFLPGMVDPVPFESFSDNPFFADGKTLQLPPPGTVPRGTAPFHYAATPEDAIRAGAELVNPIESSPEALARGAAVWASFCQVCHGPAARGDGPVAQRGFPAPPSLHAEKALALTDGQIFHIITRGQANMPSYAAQVAPVDRWRVIRYVREMQRLEIARVRSLAEAPILTSTTEARPAEAGGEGGRGPAPVQPVDGGVKNP